MRVVLFGASGMVGQGVLRECLLDDGVESVVSIGRRPCGVDHPKVRDAVHADLFDLTAVAPDLVGADAVFYCLGVSSAGMNETDYTRITYDLTMSVATALAERTTFVYVSGAGADSTEQGRTMWARVRGRTENALLALPLKTYIIRPAYIQPMNGERSSTTAYRILYRVLRPILPVVRTLLPNLASTTENIGRAMLVLARTGSLDRILASREVNALVAGR